MDHNHHHKHRRQRHHEGNRGVEEYPSKDPKVKLLDKVTSAVAVIMPFTAAPQIYNIWVLEKVEGVSAWSWGLFFVMAIPMLLYGLVHKEKPIIVLNTLWIVAYVAILSGVFVYS